MFTFPLHAVVHSCPDLSRPPHEEYTFGMRFTVTTSFHVFGISDSMSVITHSTWNSCIRLGHQRVNNTERACRKSPKSKPFLCPCVLSELYHLIYRIDGSSQQLEHTHPCCITDHAFLSLTHIHTRTHVPSGCYVACSRGPQGHSPCVYRRLCWRRLLNQLNTPWLLRDSCRHA